jgi:hypothetical protein
LYGVAAKRHGPWRLSCFEPLYGLKPLTVSIDERNGADGDFEYALDQRSDIVERLFTRSIQDAIAVQSGKPSLFVEKL